MENPGKKNNSPTIPEHPRKSPNIPDEFCTRSWIQTDIRIVQRGLDIRVYLILQKFEMLEGGHGLFIDRV